MAEISDLERGLDGTRAVGRSGFPLVEERQEAPGLAPSETIESYTYYSRSRELSEEPVTNRGLAKLPLGVRVWTRRDAEGQGDTLWAEPIHEEGHSSSPSPPPPSTSPTPPPIEETGRPNSSQRMAKRGVVQAPKKPTPKEKRQEGPKPIEYTISLPPDPEPTELVLDPEVEKQLAWERITRRVTAEEWDSAMRHLEGVHGPGEEDDVLLFYLAIRGVISPEEHRNLRSKATGDSISAWRINPNILGILRKIAAPIEELWELAGFQKRRGYIPIGEFILARGPLRPIDDDRRANNKLFKQVFKELAPKSGKDTDDVIESRLWRNNIIDEVYRRAGFPPRQSWLRATKGK